jgi:hypothetical protein
MAAAQRLQGLRSGRQATAVAPDASAFGQCGFGLQGGRQALAQRPRARPEASASSQPACKASNRASCSISG